MFDFFKSKDKKPSNVLPFPEPKVVPKMPTVKPPEPVAKECYRIGRRDDGMTTLTVISGDGFGSITLAMNDAACEQLIKMLRATYE